MITLKRTSKKTIQTTPQSNTRGQCQIQDPPHNEVRHWNLEHEIHKTRVKPTHHTLLTQRIDAYECLIRATELGSHEKLPPQHAAVGCSRADWWPWKQSARNDLKELARNAQQAGESIHSWGGRKSVGLASGIGTHTAETIKLLSNRTTLFI